jgi:hypothetical protein
LGTWCSAFAKAGGSWPKACGELPIAVRTRACRESGAGSAERIARRHDLDPAWSVLDATGAAAFREALDVDEPTWLRARGFTPEHAV